jgi:hypothetical protein
LVFRALFLDPLRRVEETTQQIVDVVFVWHARHRPTEAYGAIILRRSAQRHGIGLI